MQTTLEKQQLQIRLTKKMDEYINEITVIDNNIGYVPENIGALMSDAAFPVLETVTATNEYFENEGLLK